MHSMRHTRLARALSTLSALIALLCIAPTWAASYTYTDLGSLGGFYTNAVAINQSGQVVGYSYDANNNAHAFLYSNGTMSDLGTLGFPYSYAQGINDSGQVVGDLFEPSGGALEYNHAFLYSNGTMTDLRYVDPASYTLPAIANGINKFGQVVGMADIINGCDCVHAFLYSNGTVSDLGALDGYRHSEALGINDSGQVVGYSWYPWSPNGYSAFYHAFLYSNGTMTDLGTLGGTISVATGINNQGQIVGYSSTPNDTAYHAFLYSNGAMRDLGTLGGTSSFATGINNKGDVVGYSDYTATTGITHSFLYSGGKLLDLNNLIPSSIGILSGAIAINDAGQFVAGEFLFTPSNSNCGVQINPKEYQADLPWGPQLYDHSTVFTIRRMGCAMTALSMSLNFVSVNNDPGTLNTFMSRVGSIDFSGLGVNWDPTTRDASGPSSPFAPPKQMRFDNLGGAQYSQNDNILNPTGAFKQVNDALCSATPHPVIVGVAGLKPNSCVPSGSLPAPSSPGHFVLITGKQVDSNGVPHYSIVDPGCRSNSSLDVFNNQFVTRGIVRDPPGDISQLDVAVDNDADLMVTDPVGNRTGRDLGSGTILQAIPGSAYFSDSMDDETGDAAIELVRQVPIFQPQPGVYNVTVNGTKLSTYSLSIQAFSQDSSVQPGILLTGIEGLGSSATYQVQFTSLPGAVSTASLVASFSNTLADIDNSLLIGLIDNQGIANSLSQKITAAQNATGSARTNILNAFINHVDAQAGKHITGVAVQVLLQDAASLISQNGT